MILHRFCSIKEYQKYMAGEVLTNDTDHHRLRGDASTAKGFCFFTENPEEAKHWLSGIVDFDYCLTFFVPDEKVNPCKGRYPNWIKPGIKDGVIYRKEFCTSSYDNKSFRLLNVSTRFRSYAPLARFLKHLRLI